MQKDFTNNRPWSCMLRHYVSLENRCKIDKNDIFGNQYEVIFFEDPIQAYLHYNQFTNSLNANDALKRKYKFHIRDGFNRDSLQFCKEMYEKYYNNSLPNYLEPIDSAGL